ncbi:MAG TPA: PAS domain S-box protein, partial [Verrucomicrobiae bacterium]|nr:PAS domain S-box protein [Verrucomicrobiae bacterium]
PESHMERERSEPNHVFWAYTMWPVIRNEHPVGTIIQVTETAKFHQTMLALNEALVLGSVRQHELAHASETANAQLQKEITVRKQAEASLLLLAAIVESSDEAIIGKDLNGIITSWNRGAERLFGYASGEIVGTSIMRVVPEDRREEENHFLAMIKRGERVEQFETVRQTKAGLLIDISVTASPIRDAGGKIIGTSKVARNVSERKAAEAKIRQLNADLEQRVTDRTAQLQAANEELEAFSYSVSHDLRAPVRHVLGFVDTLQKDAGPSLSKNNLGLLAKISEAARRMGQLIDDLLDFSRLGRAELKKTKVNLDQLVAEVAADFEEETKERNIAWKIQPLPEVSADRALLRMVLVNLISNAIKFTGTRAEPRIEIACAPGGEGETVIFIRDNGAGFDPEYAHKLFGVFQRLHSRDEFEGTGIGLANVQRIIQRHGGRTWAEGVVDGGATFYFSLPKQSSEA